MQTHFYSKKYIKKIRYHFFKNNLAERKKTNNIKKIKINNDFNLIRRANTLLLHKVNHLGHVPNAFISSINILRA